MPPSIPTPQGILIPRGIILIPDAIAAAGGAIGDLLELIDDGFGNPIAQFVTPVHRLSALVFPFGNGIHPLTAGEYMEIPLPWGMDFAYWHARLDTSGDASFTVEYASTITGALSGVGGTQPSWSGARGAANIGGLDWTTTQGVRGGVVRVTHVSSTNAKTAALVISGNKHKPGP